MGMANVPRPLRWDEEHLAEVGMMSVSYHGPTSAGFDRIGSAPSLWVCKHCRMGRSLCRCSWRTDGRGGEDSDSHDKPKRSKRTWPGQGDDRARRHGDRR